METHSLTVNANFLKGEWYEWPGGKQLTKFSFSIVQNESLTYAN